MKMNIILRSALLFLKGIQTVTISHKRKTRRITKSIVLYRGFDLVISSSQVPSLESDLGKTLSGVSRSSIFYNTKPMGKDVELCQLEFLLSAGYFGSLSSPNPMRFAYNFILSKFSFLLAWLFKSFHILSRLFLINFLQFCSYIDFV